MKNGAKVVLGVLGLILFGATPYFFLYGNPNLLWICVPLILVWAFWLMMEYLRWAKTLGKK